jgi:hypothetical protein
MRREFVAAAEERLRELGHSDASLWVLEGVVSELRFRKTP